MKLHHVRFRLKKEGWSPARQRGSHEQWKHPTIPGALTINGKDSDELGPGMMKHVREIAGWKK